MILKLEFSFFFFKLKSVKKKLPEHFYLWEHVHPTLNDQATLLEQCAVRLMLATKASLITHGRELVDYEVSLRNLAEISMHNYVLNAVLARASRSYSIGMIINSNLYKIFHID